jgi:hypothetical protein
MPIPFEDEKNLSGLKSAPYSFSKADKVATDSIRTLLPAVDKLEKYHLMKYAQSLLQASSSGAMRSYTLSLTSVK